MTCQFARHRAPEYKAAHPLSILLPKQHSLFQMFCVHYFVDTFFRDAIDVTM